MSTALSMPYKHVTIMVMRIPTLNFHRKEFWVERSSSGHKEWQSKENGDHTHNESPQDPRSLYQRNCSKFMLKHFVPNYKWACKHTISCFANCSQKPAVAKQFQSQSNQDLPSGRIFFWTWKMVDNHYKYKVVPVCNLFAEKVHNCKAQDCL